MLTTVTDIEPPQQRVKMRSMIVYLYTRHNQDTNILEKHSYSQVQEVVSFFYIPGVPE